MPRRPGFETKSALDAYPPHAVTGLEFERVESAESGVAIVELRGEIDLTNASELAERLAGVADAATLVLDLARVSFVDSAALHCLFRVARERGRSGLFLAVDPESPIATTFGIVHFERAASVVPTVEDAISQIRAR
jgi:anti-anti-sigma factor